MSRAIVTYGDSGAPSTGSWGVDVLQGFRVQEKGSE